MTANPTTVSIDLTTAEAAMLRQLLTTIPYQLDAVEAHNLAWGFVQKLDAAQAVGPSKPETTVPPRGPDRREERP